MKKLKMPKMMLKKMGGRYKSKEGVTTFLKEGEPTTEYDMTMRSKDRKRKKMGQLPKMKLKPIKKY